MKKLFRRIKKKLSPLLLIPIVLLAGVLVGGYFLFFAGDDDADKTASTSRAPSSGDGSKKLRKRKAAKRKRNNPSGREFTIDSDRDEKDYALAQATGAIKTPARIALRIGAAPKQPVTVNWNVVCLLPSEGAKSSSDTFSVMPPNTRDLKLPVPDAVTCTVSANAQLTRAGRGRIKVFLVGTRRVEG